VNATKKILFVTHSLTPDKRIDQVAQTLKKQGFEIYLICRGQKKDTIPDFYNEIIYVKLNKKHLAYLPGAVSKMRKKFKELITRIAPDVIHANDLPAANIVRKIIPPNVKFVYDDHEVWEIYYKLYTKRTKNVLKKIQRKYLCIAAKMLTRKVMTKADLIIFVNDYWVKYYSKKGIEADKMISLENFPLKRDIDKALSNNFKLDPFFTDDSRKKIVTASKFSKISASILRNIDNIAQAVNELDDWVIVNFGQSDEKFEKLGVVSLGYKPRYEFLASCKKCDVVLNPLLIDELMDYCSPNRFFEAALLGVRIISSKVKTLVDKFDDLIIWLNPETPKEEIKSILKNIDKYPSGEKIQKTASKFIWENEEKKLIVAYEKLLYGTKDNLQE